MKQFFSALALFAIVAFAGFIYRNATESRGPHEYAPPGSIPAVCTQEALICADGSSVGRTGPACTFAACPLVSSTTHAVPLPTATVAPTTTTSVAPATNKSPKISTTSPPVPAL
jgi:3-deoxy-D-manno-octulosonic-acid transferase